MTWYILDDQKNPVLCDDHAARHRWIASLPEDQRTSIGCKVDHWTNGDVLVSTVFLGLDHGWNSDVPIVFETLVFGGERDQDGERYATWDEAKAGHARIVQEIVAAETAST
jgi:hypothetical protein